MRARRSTVMNLGTYSSYKKAAGFFSDPAALNYSTMSMLVFHLDTLNDALLAVAGVIYAHFLSGAQRG
jgi:hypothetical protein